MRWHASEAPSSREGPGLWAPKRFLGAGVAKGHPHGRSPGLWHPSCCQWHSPLAPKDRSSLHLSPPGPNEGSGVKRPRLDIGSKSYHKMLSLQYPQGSLPTVLNSQNSSWVRFTWSPSSSPPSHTLTSSLPPRRPVSNLLVYFTLTPPLDWKIPSAHSVPMGVTAPGWQGCGVGNPRGIFKGPPGRLAPGAPNQCCICAGAETVILS